MSAQHKFLSIGLKGSGKTSFLAALWHLVESGELETSLYCASLQPNRAYLNKIRESFLRFEQVGRTSLRNPETVELLLRDSESGAEIDLTMPDMSGELFRLQWKTRKATKEYAETAQDASGVLLFVHPEAVVKPEKIGPSLKEDGSSTTDGTEVVSWSYDHAPTQVQLIELLQFIAHLRNEYRRYRIAVVVSAWDQVKEAMAPSAWLEINMPLLSQFLQANLDTVDARIFGVSALGGDLQLDIERLRKEVQPSRRMRIISGSLEESSDLTLILRFLMNANARAA